MPAWEAAGLQLECWPPVPEHIARPWDAADELLLHACRDDAPQLIINDRYGALQCAFPAANVWGDSFAARQSALRNLEFNQRAQSGQCFWQEDDLPAISGAVMIKVPKNFELLRFWLHHCQQRCQPDTPFYLAGMVKHWPVSWLNWIEQHSEGYEQSRIEKKARLIRFTLPRALPAMTAWQGYTSEDGLCLEALPGVFAREQLDIGSRVLLAQPDPGYQGIVCDLGCGNGLLGLTLAKRHRIEHLILTDDSYLAVRSARHNAAIAGINADVRHGDCLSAVPEALDWVVCNPPFHDGHRELTNIATTMFEESREKLKRNGRLLIIANRHLPYLTVLKRLRFEVKSLGKDSRFSLYDCRQGNG